MFNLKNYILDISHYDPINFKVIEIKNLPFELFEIKDSFEKLLSNLHKEYNRRIEAEKIKTLVDITAAVCHDIRSPLAILEICFNESKKCLSQQEIELHTEALQCIRDITNNLLNKYRDPNIRLLSPNSSLEKHVLMTSIIESIISQKKQEWKHNPCNIIVHIETSAHNKWVKVIESEVKRIFSNLLNNAYEAFINKGRLEITLKCIDNILIIIIADNGIGIFSDKIGKVLQGLSTKHLGCGMGLSTAKQFMQKLGGALKIESKVNSGTRISLHFPIYQIQNADNNNLKI